MALFLDGFNEFYSLRYGGRPGDDALTMPTETVRTSDYGLADQSPEFKSSGAGNFDRNRDFANSIKVPQRIDLARVSEEVGYYLLVLENAAALSLTIR